ncbi:MAG: hypothetical protein ACXACA_00820 [Candidatus Ranarchaeia archaeon]|jgi:hypothetical protein
MNLEVGLIEVLKVIVEVNMGLLLLNKWRKSFHPMYTDLPFLFGLAFTFIGVGEIFDVLTDLGILVYTILLFKIRWLFIVAMMSVSLFGLAHIWIPNRTKAKFAIPSVFGGSWLGMTVILPDKLALYQVLTVYMLVFFIPYHNTFALINYYRRLPEANSSILLVGMLIVLAGQVTKSAFMAIGLLWISELVDLVGFGLSYFAFVTQPKWAEQTQIVMEAIP